MTNITAKNILTLLRARHKDEVFLPEAYLHGNVNHFLDAWVLFKSWEHPRTIGYEIKVRRADFLQDNKWPAYLLTCNEFYFVAPKGIISKEELPPEAGLIEVTTQGNKLITRKKSPYRQVQIPEKFYRAILFGRVEIDPPPKTGKSYWEKWLEHREVNYYMGHMISGSLRFIVTNKLREYEEKNQSLENRLLKYQKLEKMLVTSGIDPEKFGAEFKLRELIREGRSFPDIREKLLSISHQVSSLLNEV